MNEIFLRLVNQFGVPEDLTQYKEIVASIPRDNGMYFFKHLTKNQIEIVNAAQGEFKIKIELFDRSALVVKSEQDILVTLTRIGKVSRALFPKSFGVRIIEDKGEQKREIFQ